MSEPKQKGYIFGPVPSRRLGRSLGVDLVPFKTCTFDCIYCQLGRTTNKTIQRADYVPIADVIEELKERLEQVDRPDYITLSGSGEPTLHSDIGKVIQDIKGITEIPVAVLTNGSLLWDPDVRRACCGADVVIPTLTAADEATFCRIHRPCQELSLERIVQGMVDFRKEFEGQIWLEVFLLAGINDSEQQVLALGNLIDRIRPDRIQLNTAVRPTAEEEARAVMGERMARLCELLGPKAEVIADFFGVHFQPTFEPKRDEVLAMLGRRPCTAEDVAKGLAIHLNEAIKYIGELQREGLITSSKKGNAVYYAATRGR